MLYPKKLLILFFAAISSQLYSQSLTSSVLPIVVIESEEIITDDPKVIANMGIIYHPGQQNTLGDAFNDYNGKIGIEIRGSSSQNFPKKQYSVELRDDAGNDIDASLMGLPAEEDWVLFAPYNDKSLMRDALAYHLGGALGTYAPRTRFCELVLNGEYKGVYVLIEKIKRGEDRLDISRLRPTDISGEDVTGGYIIKIDKATGGALGWFSPFPAEVEKERYIKYQYEYPDGLEIKPEQKQYIQKYVTDFETVMKSDHYNDPDEGYHKYIDVSSFVDYLIVNELSKNPDAYRISAFMHKRKDTDGGKLHMGPIWDFNLAFGNVNYCKQWDPSGFVLEFNSICPGDLFQIPFWWNKLFQDEHFQEQVAMRWTALRKGPYALDAIYHYIDSVAAVLSTGPQQRNFETWPVLGAFVHPNAFVGFTFDEEVNYLKTWVADRIEWLDAQWLRTTNSIPAELQDLRVTAFPNPAGNRLQVRYSLAQAGELHIEILDSQGRAKISKSAHHQPGDHEEEISLDGVADGLYFLRLGQGGKTAFVKIMKGL